MTHTSRYRGVWWNRRDRRWVARVCIYRRKYHAGHFGTELDAARAYDAVMRHFGCPAAWLNRPDLPPVDYRWPPALARLRDEDALDPDLERPDPDLERPEPDEPPESEWGEIAGRIERARREKQRASSQAG